jgi:urease accessory protein
MTSRVASIPALLAASVPALAFAHTGSGLGVGFSHPWSGVDHVLAMLAVGLWAVQLGGRALAWAPMSFLALMAGGGMLASAGVALPTELGIALSVFVLGALVACAARFPMLASALLVGVFAVFHGHAHGNELAVGVSATSQALGFLGATALLIALGMATAASVQRTGGARLVRVPGAAIALYGAWLVLGAAA